MNSLDEMAPRPAITTPRDLALPGRVLSSVLALFDGLNPFPVSQPVELDFADDDRKGQAAAFLKWREVVWASQNAARRAQWRARCGGTEAAGPTIGVIITPKAARFENRGIRLKTDPLLTRILDQRLEERAQATKLQLVPKGKRG